MASSLTTSLITPLPPKTPLELIDLLPLGLWQFHPVPCVLSFDHELDKDRLVQAIKLLSTIWPTIAGRYERRPAKLADGRDGHEYFVRLTSSGIPFATQDFHGSPLPNRDVIQSSLEPFLPAIGAKRTDFTRQPSDDGEAYLFAVRLTTVINNDSRTRTSLLGVNVSHIIADGATTNKILQHLSHIYVHLSLPEETNWPIFNAKIHFDNDRSDVPFPPDQTMDRKWAVHWVSGPKIAPDGDLKVEDDGCKVVTLFVSRKEIREIRADMHGTSNVRLSDQDVLSAWWFSLFRRVDLPVSSVSYVFDARQILPASHPAIDDSLSKTGVSFANYGQFPLPPAESYATQLESDALAIRNTINALRTNPSTVLEWFSYITWQMQLEAEAGQHSALEPAMDSEIVCVNSNGRCDWTPTFGGEVGRYHTFSARRRFLRVFQRNPGHGEKMVNSRERDLELAFKIEWEKFDKLMGVVQGDRERWKARAEEK